MIEEKNRQGSLFAGKCSGNRQLLVC